VPAEVRERANLAVIVTAEQNTRASERNGALVTRRRQVRSETNAGPAGAEEVPLFPAEHCGVGVRSRRQHATVTERPERVGHAGRVERSSRIRSARAIWDAGPLD
jgi:hypothetical protein